MARKSTMYHIRGIYRPVESLTERPEVADMVEMVVSDQNRRERIHIETILQKGLLESSQAYTGIYEDTARLTAEIVAVSAASA